MKLRRLLTLAIAAAFAAAPVLGDESSLSELQRWQSQTQDVLSGMQAVLTRIQKTSVTGYVQARAMFQHTAAPTNNLFVKLARLNLRNTSDAGTLMFSLDGGQNSVTVKDAYFDWHATSARGQRQGLTVRFGQFFRPFGYELERSETLRELPERPAAWAVLFPGNRDQGAYASIGITPGLIFDAGVLNGSGSSTAALSFKDTDKDKDAIARLRCSLFSPRIDLALSGYKGRQTINGTAAVAAATGFVDTNGNGIKDVGESTVVVTPAKAAVPTVKGDRDRWGAALNFYNLLGGTFRGEYILARDLTANLGAGLPFATADAVAGYALYTHAVLIGFTVGARYDFFDPDVHDKYRLGGDGEQGTVGVVAQRLIGDNITLNLSWERQRLKAFDKKTSTTSLVVNRPVTFQAQYAF